MDAFWRPMNRRDPFLIEGEAIIIRCWADIDETSQQQ